MSTKDQISSTYTKAAKQVWMNNPHPPEKRKVLLVGWGTDNIADVVGWYLNERGFHTVGYSRDEFRAKDVEDIPRLETFDTIVFNNGRTHLDWIENQPIDEIVQVVNDTLTETMIGVSSFVRATINKPWQKHIVMIGSMAYNHVLNGSAPYCAAKAGLNMFAKCIAHELAPKNYNVFCVHPSNVKDAPMSEDTILGLMRYRGLTRPQAEAYWSAGLARGEFLTMEEIARTIEFLISGDASYLSGSPIELAGGQR